MNDRRAAYEVPDSINLQFSSSSFWMKQRGGRYCRQPTKTMCSAVCRHSIEGNQGRQRNETERKKALFTQSDWFVQNGL